MHFWSHYTRRTTVEVSKDFLKKLGPSADRLNLTNNQLTCMVVAFTNHSGGKIDNIALSKSTTRRKRKVARREMAADFRRNFTCNPGQINFDGKLMVDLYGFGKVNRLAIVLVQEDCNKILAIVKTESSTGKVEAEAVKKALDEWEITEKIIACGFDTTSSNTGVRKGACTLLQELLSRQILWLACRHHILELVVGAAFFELFGDTTSPEVTLFKVLKKSWDTLDLDDLQLPDVPSLYRADTEELLAWINTHLQPENVETLRRGDYKELLELAKLILGGSIERKKGYTFHLTRPGADHHARWMAKSIYILKMVLFMHQLPELHWQTKKKIGKMSQFVIFVYIQAWFAAPSLFTAASNDLLLYKRLIKFRLIHKKISIATSTVFLRHPWYLTEESIVFSLFNEDLPMETRNMLASRIGELDSGDLEIRKPTLPSFSAKSVITEFVGDRSRLLFDLLGIQTGFLLSPDWQMTPEYDTVKTDRQP